MTAARSLRHLAVALAAVVLLAACSSGADDETEAGVVPDATPSTEAAGELLPERIGDPVTVESGGEDGAGWEVTAQDSVEGTCILVDDELDRQTEACGFDVPELHAVGYFDHTGVEGSPQVVAGVVTSDAGSVRLELEGGEVVEVAPLELEGRFPAALFAVKVTGRPPVVAVVAVGPDGAELERRP